MADFLPRRFYSIATPAVDDCLTPRSEHRGRAAPGCARRRNASAKDGCAAADDGWPRAKRNRPSFFLILTLSARLLHELFLPRCLQTERARLRVRCWQQVAAAARLAYVITTKRRSTAYRMTSMPVTLTFRSLVPGLPTYLFVLRFALLPAVPYHWFVHLYSNIRVPSGHYSILPPTDSTIHCYALPTTATCPPHHRV